jgi:hypothetical protein
VPKANKGNEYCPCSLGDMVRMNIMNTLPNRFSSSRGKEFRDVLNYMERICQSEKIETRFTLEGDEVVVGA